MVSKCLFIVARMTGGTTCHRSIYGTRQNFGEKKTFRRVFFFGRFIRTFHISHDSIGGSYGKSFFLILFGYFLTDTSYVYTFAYTAKGGIVVAIPTVEPYPVNR